MKALICTAEIYSDGFYIQQVTDTEFPVADDWFFVDCPDNVTRERHYYVQTSGTFPVRQEVLDNEAEVAALSSSDPDGIVSE